MRIVNRAYESIVFSESTIRNILNCVLWKIREIEEQQGLQLERYTEDNTIQEGPHSRLHLGYSLQEASWRDSPLCPQPPAIGTILDHEDGSRDLTRIYRSPCYIVVRTPLEHLRDGT